MAGIGSNGRRLTARSSMQRPVGVGAKRMTTRMTSSYEVWVTPWRAAWARRVLAYAQQQHNNLHIEISAARVIDAYEQGRAVACIELEVAIEWVAARLDGTDEPALSDRPHQLTASSASSLAQIGGDWSGHRQAA